MQTARQAGFPLPTRDCLVGFRNPVEDGEIAGHGRSDFNHDERFTVVAKLVLLRVANRPINFNALDPPQGVTVNSSLVDGQIPRLMIQQVTLVTASNVTVMLPFSSLKMDGLNGPTQLRHARPNLYH